MNNEQKHATLDDVVAALQKNQEVLEEIQIWGKINGSEKVQGLLTKYLNSPEKILVYHLSDGKTTREIGTICKIDPKTVSNYWRSWYKLGIVKSEKARGGGSRYIKIFDLSDYGIKIPELQKQEKESTSASNEVEATTGSEENNEQQ